MAWDQQGYYQDPYQQYDQNQWYDPNSGYDPYGYNPNEYGYDGYGYGYGYQEPQEDTESEKLRQDELEKERIEAIESNRLYLRKIKKHCVKEDFTDLDRLQLFLFEILVESMEVNSESSLGLVPSNGMTPYISARVQFLNSPWMEICERDVMVEGNSQDNGGESEYFQTLGDASQSPYVESYNNYTEPPPPPPAEVVSEKSGESQEEGGESEYSVSEKEVQFTTKWENASGKSCLFSETALMITREIEKYPVVLQALRCVMSPEGKETCEPIGYAQVRLPEDFGLSVIQSSKDGVILPVSSVHRATLDITNVFGVKKGKVDLFLRLSCFGPAIITSFRSSGQERKYIFKPSPLDSNFKVPDEISASTRGDLLKPIISEEEKTVGITVQKEYDIFQKPVLWKRPGDINNCGCKHGQDGDSNEGVSRLSSLGSLRLPISSDISLCKNVLPPSEFRKLKLAKPTCDWHSLVSAGIKNSPGGNCGCLDSVQKSGNRKHGSTGGKTDGTGPLPFDPDFDPRKGSVPSTVTKISRVYKMSSHKKGDPPPPVKGFGLCNECTDCGCDCPLIKDTLDSKKLFFI